MHARLSLLTATAAVLLATSAMAAPPTTTSSSSTPAANSSAAPAAPAASNRMATNNTAHSAAHANASSTQALYTRAQQKLKDMGLYSGPVDGSRNAAYVDAIRKFQRDHHLQASGRL